jgi:cysteine-rich repeat protein
MAGDGCSATCQLEGAVAEVEPNEDGTPSTGGSTIDGNDFGSTHADTNGAFTTNTTIAAAITPAGDEDVFKITNTSATMVALHLDVWNVGPGYSIGMPCGTSIDTGMHVRNAAGVSLASNDDRDGANDRCSTLTYPLAPGATVYAHVSDYADDDAIGAYALVVQFDPIVCGDGAVGAGEQCDDTNTMNGDGCSSTCQFELVEMEPNDDGSVSMGGSGTVGNDFSSTAANGPYNHSVIIAAAMAVAGDEDVFAFTNPGANAVNVKFDIWNLDFGYGVGAACDTSIDTGLHIRNATGMSLADNDDRDGADDRCSGLTYSIAAGATVYVHVVDYDDDDTITSYALQAVYQ